MLNNQTNEPSKNGSSLAAHRLIARISHTHSTAAADLAASTAFRDPQAGAPGLLNVPYSTLAGADPERVPSRAWYPQPSPPPRYDQV